MLKPKGNRGRPQAACIACLYAVGIGCATIAKLVRYTKAAVTKVMSRHGLPVLSRGAAGKRTTAYQHAKWAGRAEELGREAAFRRALRLTISTSKQVFEDVIKSESALAKAAMFRGRYKHEPEFAIKVRLRRRVRKMVSSKGTMKAGTTMELVGCSSAFLMEHIQSLFSPGMHWNNRHAWHIDHIRPCSSFDLTDPSQQRECFHYTNLQPLWAKDNLMKSDKRGEISRVLGTPFKK